MANSRGSVAIARAVSPQTETESLPTLLSRLGDDIMQLVDSKINLLKVEIREEAKAYVRAGLMIAVGGVVAAVGFALLNMAVGFGVATFFANTELSEPAKYALGFLITGLFYILLGGILVLVMKNRLATLDLVPNRTVEELRKDKQWLKNEL